MSIMGHSGKKKVFQVGFAATQNDCLGNFRIGLKWVKGSADKAEGPCLETWRPEV
jgi:hypothetical protein